jgi:hypothetical protein
VPDAGQSAADFPTVVTDTIAPLQATCESMFNEGYRFNGIIDGYNMDSDGTPTSLATLASRDAHNVSLLITGTTNNRVSSIGLCLGKIARTSVGRSIGAVSDGALEASTMYLTNQIAITDASITPADIDLLGEKQFLFCRTWIPNKSGYFFNDGATCDLDTKPLARLEFNRLANRLSDNAYTLFLEEIGKNLPVENNGDLDKGYCLNKAQEFISTYVTPLIISGDLSNATMQVSGTAFNTTRTLYFKLNILGAPALMNITGEIEFVISL